MINWNFLVMVFEVVLMLVCNGRWWFWVDVIEWRVVYDVLGCFGIGDFVDCYIC